jgi:steroid delta-isomerase-like uncharacterized protein
MSLEENKAGSRRAFEEIWNKGNLTEADEVYATHFVQHSPTNPRDLEAYKLYISATRAAFPDLHFAIEDMIAEEDKVVTRFTVTGTHKGRFLGISPSGAQVEVTGISIDRHEDGQIVEHWGNSDQFGLLQQLGAISMSG